MKTGLIIDRIENGWAVIEYAQAGITFSMPLTLLPEGAGEGDIIEIGVTLLEEETQRRRTKLERLLDDNMED